MSGASRQVLSGAILSYLGIGLSIVGGFLVTPLIIGHLGRSLYGVFTLSMSVVTLLTFDFGLNSAVARFVAYFEARGDRASALAVMRIVRSLYLVFSLLLLLSSALVWFGAPTLFSALTEEEVADFRVAFALASGIMVLNFPLLPANGTLQGLGRFVALRGSDVLWRLATICVSVTVVYAKLSMFTLVVGLCSVALVTSLFRGAMCLRLRVWAWRLPRAPSDLRRDVARFTSWSFLVAIGQRLMLTVMPAILASLSGTVDVAGFAVAAMIEGYVWVVANALNGLFLPQVAKLDSNGDQAGLQRLLEGVGRYQLIVVGLLVSGFVIFGRPFIDLWLGPDFSDVYPVAVLLILPSLIVQTQEVAMSTLVARGDIRYRGIGTMLAAVVNLGLAMVLVPEYGSLGAAVSIASGSFAGYIVAMNVAYSRRTGLSMSRFFYRVHGRMLPRLAVPVVGFFGILSVFNIVDLIGLVGWVLTYVALYCAWAWWVVLEREERLSLRGLWRRRSGQVGAAS